MWDVLFLEQMYLEIENIIAFFELRFNEIEYFQQGFSFTDNREALFHGFCIMKPFDGCSKYKYKQGVNIDPYGGMINYLYRFPIPYIDSVNIIFHLVQYSTRNGFHGRFMVVSLLFHGRFTVFHEVSRLFHGLINLDNDNHYLNSRSGINPKYYLSEI